MPLPWILVFSMIFFCFFTMSLYVSYFYLPKGVSIKRFSKTNNLYVW